MKIGESAHPLVAFYGDDFTGSTDALAQLHRGGLSGILLFRLPDSTELEQLAADVDVLGMAGISRSLPTAEISAEVRPIFQAFARLSPRLIQYKICSTFDSSAEIGSLGRVIEIGREVFGPFPAPVLPAQPEFGRYTVFGNHFAAAGGHVYRLDRHPTMSRHPSTPMAEADLQRHLAEQTDLPVLLMDLPHLTAPLQEARAYYRELVAEKPGAIIFDAVEDWHLARAAELIWPETGQRPVFALGSGGLGYGVGRYLHERGAGVGTPTSGSVEPAERMLVVSGSASPQTASQIEWALHHGWHGIRLDTRRLVERGDNQAALADARAAMLRALERGPGVVVYTTLGPADPVMAETRAAAARSGIGPHQFVEVVGQALGTLVESAIEQRGIHRVIVAGGDTSGRTVRTLDAYGLEIVGMMVVAGTLCRLLSHNLRVNGVEVMLKGGQVGNDDLFEVVRCGRQHVIGVAR